MNEDKKSNDCGCGCGCGHDHEHDYEPEYITLEFDDDTEIVCEILGAFDVGDKEYIALAPEDKEDEVYFYGYKENGEEFELVEIESDDEFQEVVKVFNQLIDK